MDNTSKFSILFSLAAVGILMGYSTYLFVQLQEFKEGNTIAELAQHEDEVTKLHNWKILNLMRENDISPNQRLTMKVDVKSKWTFNSKLFATIEIFQADNRTDTYESTFSFGPEQSKPIDFPFFLKNEGPQDLKIELLFKNETDDYIFEQRIRNVNGLTVISSQDKLLQQQNTTLFWTQIGTISATMALVLVTWYNMRRSNLHTIEQLKLTTTEIQSRLRAEIDIIVAASNLTKIDDEKWEGEVRLTIRNDGTVSAKNIKVHFQDPTFALTLPQLVREEEKIKRSFFPIPGSIKAHSVYPEPVIHKTPMDKSDVYELAVWVTYDYANVKNAELIQIVKINAQSHSDGPIYEKEEIDYQREHKNEGM